MAYPISLDSFATPGATLASNPHSSLHTANSTALTAIETKVGIDSSAVATSIDYLLKNTSSSDPGHKHTFSSLSQFNVGASPATNDVLQFNGTKWANTAAGSLALKFGGTGSDGALSVTSGTTTINCSNAAVVVKNYTSISITGSGTLAFSNPNTNGTIVILKSQTSVVLTSSSAPMIAMNAMGAAGGAGKSGGAPLAGDTGSSGISINQFQCGAGGAGQPSNGAGGTAGAAPAFLYQTSVQHEIAGKYPFAFVGAGGGGGAITFNGGSSSSGTGGRGGGCLIIECGGALNFTTASGISVAGATGVTGTGSGNASAGGGGGGGGGFAAIFYNSLTASSGTITISAGSGASGYNVGTQTSGGGGGGGGAAVGSAGISAQTGGNGGAGASLVASNTEYS